MTEDSKNVPVVLGNEAFVPATPVQQVRTQYVTAVAVQKPRVLASVVQNVLEEAKFAGSHFFYGWPVKNRRTGQTVQVEGGSIGLAMALARHYGNAAVEVSVSESDTHYLFTAHFIDLETGFTCTRLYRQRKSQEIGMEDVDRAEDIAFQIGQSKAIRNAVLRAMPDWLVDEAIRAAKEAELKGIKPENIVLARAKVLDFFARYGVTKERIEAAVGKPLDAWDPEDIVSLRGQATAIKEGRVRPAELFPVVHSAEAQAEPTVETEAVEKPKPSRTQQVKERLRQKRPSAEQPESFQEMADRLGLGQTGFKFLKQEPTDEQT